MNTAENLATNNDYENKIEHTIHEYGQVWRLNGKPHREDGPALISLNGDYEYYKNGILHNDKGPASMHYSYVHTGRKGNVPVKNYRWYLHGEHLSAKEWRKRTGNETFFEKIRSKIQQFMKKD